MKAKYILLFLFASFSVFIFGSLPHRITTPEEDNFLESFFSFYGEKKYDNELLYKAFNENDISIPYEFYFLKDKDILSNFYSKSDSLNIKDLYLAKKKYSETKYAYIFLQILEKDYENFPLEKINLNLIPKGKYRQKALKEMIQIFLLRGNYSKAKIFFNNLEAQDDSLELLFAIIEQNDFTPANDERFNQLLENENSIILISLLPQFDKYSENDIQKMIDASNNFSNETKVTTLTNLALKLDKIGKSKLAKKLLKDAYKIDANKLLHYSISLQKLGKRNELHKLCENISDNRIKDFILILERKHSFPDLIENIDFIFKKSFQTHFHVSNFKDKNFEKIHNEKHANDNIFEINTLYNDNKNEIENLNLDYKTLLNSTPKNNKNKNYLNFRQAQLAYLNKDYKLAKSHLDSLIISSKDIEFFKTIIADKLGKSKEKNLRKVINNENSYDKLFLLAEISMKNNFYELADSTFSKCALDSNNVIKIADYYLDNQRDDLALNYLKKANQTIKVKMKIANVNFNLGNYQKAFDSYNEILPESKSNKNIKEIILRQKKCSEILEKSFYELVENQFQTTKNSRVKAYLFYENILIKEKQKNWNLVEELGRSFVDFYPKHEYTEAIKVKTLKAKQNLGHDFQLLEERIIALAEEVRSPEILNYWGSLKIAQKDSLSAIQKWSEANDLRFSNSTLDSLIYYGEKINHTDLAKFYTDDFDKENSKFYYESLINHINKNDKIWNKIKAVNNQFVRDIISVQNNAEDSQAIIDNYDDNKKEFFEKLRKAENR